MAAKSAKRRLSRAMPLNADPRFHLAAAMEEAVEERGASAWIDPQRGLQIEGEANDAPRINHEQRGAAELLAPRVSAAPLPPALGGAADEKTAAEWDIDLGEAAKNGTAELVRVWATVPREHKSVLEAAKDRRHKPTAATADAALAEKDA
jgi:hypothetical protein